MFGILRVASDSFDEIVHRRGSQVLRTAFRMLGNRADAEDASQEAFLRLLRHGTDFADEAALGAWLYRVTLNLCVDRMRSSRPTCQMPELRSTAPSAEAEVLRKERKHRLLLALATLPVKERAAVTLREIEGLSTAEVAHILGSTEGTVRSQVSNGMARLREIMGREER